MSAALTENENIDYEASVQLGLQRQQRPARGDSPLHTVPASDYLVLLRKQHGSEIQGALWWLR